MLLENLAITGAMIVLCVTIHALGLIVIMALMGSDKARRLREGGFHWRGFGIVLAVFGLLGLHAAEITVYALLYQWLGQFPDFETAIYYSGSTFTTVGYGDVVLGDARRLLAAGEGILGLILIGWSTAILVAMTARLQGATLGENPERVDGAPQGRV